MSASLRVGSRFEVEDAPCCRGCQHRGSAAPGGESGITCITLRGSLKAAPPSPTETALRPFAASHA